MSTVAINTIPPGQSIYSPSYRRNGILEEERFREALRSTGKLDVRYDETLDFVYKIDALVLVKDAPLLPAVGVQFTLRNSPKKQQKAIEVVRQTRVVNRFLYLRSCAPMTKRAAGILYSMVLLVASSAYDIVSAEIETDSAGNYSFSGIESYPQG